MGGIKKLFGGGSSSVVVEQPAVEQVKTDPVVTQVSTADTEADTTTTTTKKKDKNKQGFASTRVASSLLNDTNQNGRSTLG